MIFIPGFKHFKYDLRKNLVIINYLLKDLYGTWTLVQKIEFDDYLAGVLPYEIGPNSPLEALKAQAVIARTRGIFNSDRFNMDKYH